MLSSTTVFVTLVLMLSRAHVAASSNSCSDAILACLKYAPSGGGGASDAARSALLRVRRRLALVLSRTAAVWTSVSGDIPRLLRRMDRARCEREDEGGRAEVDEHKSRMLRLAEPIRVGDAA